MSIIYKKNYSLRLHSLASNARPKSTQAPATQDTPSHDFIILMTSDANQQYRKQALISSSFVLRYNPHV